MQDYLAYRGYSYERLDGSVRAEERFCAVDRFQKENAAFVFLLSTRAGGQGLNLVAADVAIFFDSDFNPQQVCTPPIVVFLLGLYDSWIYLLALNGSDQSVKEDYIECINQCIAVRASYHVMGLIC